MADLVQVNDVLTISTGKVITFKDKAFRLIKEIKEFIKSEPAKEQFQLQLLVSERILELKDI